MKTNIKIKQLKQLSNSLLEQTNTCTDAQLDLLIAFHCSLNKQLKELELKFNNATAMSTTDTQTAYSRLEAILGEMNGRR